MTHQKKPHPHAAIMKAYADNTETRVLMNHEDEDKWVHTNPAALLDYRDQEFFLCLPKHKEAVLTMLNGGKAQVKSAVDWAEWLDVVDSHAQQPWHPEDWYMRDEWESRIKPKKDEFSELLEGFNSKEPISNEMKEELIYKLIESVYGSGFLIKFSDIKPELQ